ncbi:aminotransferase class V-fold PLP-dependent enzyme [Bacillus aquiflavi]|uniref:Aminotransferase class V-fold PLP-dependent enzyme n=1 Tax=Bacillus aquiflavi TaxID=2672567 RepID=A0A6B3VZS0_9BACI|nr:aminotransferase class V-fold PLP-dependent enzyme [Bacillus aquiflavi]MBA4536708.1 aminotransferase class V-fold PLP-dependent enzyme [Bacillus aquiflavi]NEY81076.1 aminotransferase class V-fold PLP-dependent enzyme [Bacillus aquiflavi]
MTYQFHSYRSLFPILSDYVYLANCSQGALALPVSKAIEEYNRQLLFSGRNWKQSIAKMEETREKFAKLIGAETDEIAILTSVSDAISAIASCLPFRNKKKKIILTDIDFPTVAHIWLAQEQFKNNVTFIHSTNGMIHLTQYEKEVTNETLLTCIPHVSFYNGYKQNIKEIADIVHRKGSLLFVDAYQSAGHIPINVKEMDIDILTTGTRKYMLGIPGVAFLYIKKELAQQLKPKLTGWFGQESTAVFNMSNPVFATGARRFETGTPSFISIYAACEAINLLLQIGVHNIQLYLQQLADYTRNFGAEKGLQIIGPFSAESSSSMTAFYAKNALKVEQLLKEKKVIVAARNDVIRIAPHFYNNKDELTYAITELARLMMEK